MAIRCVSCAVATVRAWGEKPHRQLPAADLWQLVEAAADERRAFVGLLAFAGLRVSEALGLTWADVDLDARVLHVRRQLDRRTLLRVRAEDGAGGAHDRVGRRPLLDPARVEPAQRARAAVALRRRD